MALFLIVAPIDTETDNEPEAGLLSWAAGRTAGGLPNHALTVRRGDANCEYGAGGFVVLWPAVHMLVDERPHLGWPSFDARLSASRSFKATTNSARSQLAISSTPVSHGRSAATAGARVSVSSRFGWSTSGWGL
jgi:hypothetical protein